MLFYVGLHQPSDAKHFDRACISVRRLEERVKPLTAEILLDSGAFTELYNPPHCYRHSVAEYAAKIRRISKIAFISIAVSQDYMCEPFILAKTGLTIADHQRLTIERYDALVLEDTAGVPIMPVLQGYQPEDYVAHLRAYGDRLRRGMRVGVGSVCKRNGKPVDVLNVLRAIKAVRPDLRLHGFGLKKTALALPAIAQLLYSADSMAWSYHARINGRSGNDWREAKRYEEQIASMTRYVPAPAPIQLELEV